ncbi:MAG: hypothetical protein K0S03_2013 [Burkholderiales bacterium]|jgi:hypothetical protein|nr:hypothetical protein [Burkholderiales bacterium]
MKKMGTYPIFPIFLLLLAPLAAQAQMHECTLNPNDPQVAVQLAGEGSALELRRQADGCRLELDCKVRAAPARLRYDLATLKGLKTPPVASQITNITFDYADGTTQTCKVVGAQSLPGAR